MCFIVLLLYSLLKWFDRNVFSDIFFCGMKLFCGSFFLWNRFSIVYIVLVVVIWIVFMCILYMFFVKILWVNMFCISWLFFMFVIVMNMSMMFCLVDGIVWCMIDFSVL